MNKNLLTGSGIANFLIGIHLPEKSADPEIGVPGRWLLRSWQIKLQMVRLSAQFAVEEDGLLEFRESAAFLFEGFNVKYAYYRENANPLWGLSVGLSLKNSYSLDFSLIFKRFYNAFVCGCIAFRREYD